MERYIGLDVHAASTTFAVIGESGKRLGSHVVETNGQSLVEQLKTIVSPRPGPSDRLLQVIYTARVGSPCLALGVGRRSRLRGTGRACAALRRAQGVRSRSHEPTADADGSVRGLVVASGRGLATRYERRLSTTDGSSDGGLTPT